MAEIQAHYAIEKELSDRLRHSGRADRLILYRTLNEELFRRVPSHPLLTRKKDPLARARKVAEEMKLLGPLLRPDSTFLEVGPGDCALSFEVARRVKKVYAIDVSEEITRSEAFPPNLELIISDGCAVPVAGESVDVAYSNQLMEHLHPDDGREQLRNIHAALKPGGKYLCITPNRLSGPHDISVYFDEVATGFHLKEYTNQEVVRLFRETGFSRVRVVVNIKVARPRVPVFAMAWIESVIDRLPGSARRSLRPFLRLLGVRVLGTKY